MGATGSTRRVTFEADENENITVVKGVRVRAGLPRAWASSLGQILLRSLRGTWGLACPALPLRLSRLSPRFVPLCCRRLPPVPFSP